MEIVNFDSTMKYGKTEHSKVKRFLNNLYEAEKYITPKLWIKINSYNMEKLWENANILKLWVF